MSLESLPPYSIPDYAEPTGAETLARPESEPSFLECVAEIAQRLQREEQRARVIADEAHYTATLPFRRRAAADARNPRLTRRARALSSPDCAETDGLAETCVADTPVQVLPAPVPPPPQRIIRS